MNQAVLARAPTGRARAPADHRRAIVRTLEDIGETLGIDRALRDVIAASAAALHQRGHALRHGGRADPDVERRFEEAQKPYDDRLKARFGEVLGALTLLFDGGVADHLGQVYMGEEFAKHRARAQFFTPWELCRLMAAMTLQGVERLDAWPIRIMEPACGSGAMVLAAAEALRKRGLDPRLDAEFHLVDVDPLCADMALVQCALAGLPAVVCTGDALAQTASRVWATPFWRGPVPPPERFFDR